ncbi:MAG: TIGR04255 family protein [Dehalococcoidia bacterium]
MNEVITPLGPEVPEVPLDRAPLAKVIVQVSFPVIASITTQEFIAPFQELIRARYPIASKEMQAGILLTPEKAISHEGGAVWRFKDKGGKSQVSLSPTFLAFDTDAYLSRAQFLDDFRVAAEALANTVRPVTFERLGVRYVDRVADPDSVPLAELIKPEVLGHCKVELGDSGARLEYGITDTMVIVDDRHLHARWGILPGGQTLDPFVEPISEKSWILDLDMFSSNGGRDFDATRLVALAEEYSKSIYRFFRWAVTDDFLRYFGGTV